MIKGRVILNRNICDNAPECGGIEVCPTGALYWDEEKESIEYNAEICEDCGACVEACPVEAILWGFDDEDYKIKVQKVEKETRKVEELVVERYGAKPIASPIPVANIEEYLNTANSSLCLLEFFTDDSIDCLLHSIRVEEIKTWISEPIEYVKVKKEENDEVSQYGIKEYPSLLVFRKHEQIGCISGHFSDDETSKNDFRRRLLSIVES